ncbi:MAG: hypothetical protein K0S00_4155 [Xanthobacteraceae bacterium]|jgi:hypothetical protein|nr:hypothetical protein [Xanthobacteraceae bacterium]
MASKANGAAAPNPRKRLILCLDGTWNTADGDEITNIVRLRDMLQPGLTAGIEQRIYYDEGVGTQGWFARYVAGATGEGLDVNVRQAYRFLSQFYEPGDEIYLFGFSRGAFTARSLAGYIGASGLLKQENCTQQNEERAWAHYRTDAKDRYPHEGLGLAELCHEKLRIRALGVFDTVGSLGIPLDIGAAARERFQFHDTTLSSIIDFSLHAVAVDEKRGPFPPSLWQVPQHTNFKAVEQVWFPGVHSDIGGGYGDGGVGALTLKWMLDRIDGLNADYKQPSLVLRDGERQSLAPNGAAPIHESRSREYVWSRYRPTLRVIAQQRPSGNGFSLASLPPHARPIGEYLHLSVLDRLRRGNDESGQRYNPITVRHALDRLFSAGQRALTRPTVQLGFVGKNGRPLDWIDDERDASELSAALPPEYLDPLALARMAWAGSAASAPLRPSDEGRVGGHEGHEEDVRVEG